MQHDPSTRAAAGLPWATTGAKAVARVGLLALLGGTTAGARPLPTDPRLLTGTLDNGVRWIHRPHDYPPGRTALMMHVNTGSLNETDEQRGLAHFIEHMVFNGTEHFAPGELVPYFERIGMEFGPDLNANTSMDRTAYKLFVPGNDEPQLDQALMVLSDYAFGALLLEAEIDNERAIILEEARSRKSASQRIRDRLWPRLFAGTRFAERLPIGTEEVIRGATRRDFVDYYRTWYRPENVTVIVVGAAERERVQRLVEKWFGPYRPPVPPREPMTAGFKRFTEQRAIVLADSELTSARVQLFNMLPGRPPVTAVEAWRRGLVESIADRAVARRCDERVKRGEAPYRQAGTDVADFFHEALGVWAWAEGEPADWAPMLEALVMEISRAREYGFGPRELELVKRELLARAERAVRTEPTRDARSLVNDIFEAVNEQVPVLSARQEFDLLTELLPTITAAEVGRAFRRCFAPGTFAYVVTLPDAPDVPVPGDDDVLAAARAAWARRVEPYEDRGPGLDLLAAMPEPGSVGETTRDAELGVISAWLANGARVHHRFMDDKKDQVYVSVSFAGGAIEETPDNLGVTAAAAVAVNSPATSRLDATAVRDLLAGRNLAIRGGSGGDAFIIQVSGSPADLELGLQLVHALATDGRVESSAFEDWQQRTLQQVDAHEKDVRHRAGDAMGEIISGGDPRRMLLPRGSVEAITRDQAQRWFDRLCRERPVELAIVGDVDWDTARPLLERYVGSLPERPRSDPDLERLREHPPRPPGPLVRRVEVETVTPAAVAYAGFISCDGRAVQDSRALRLAANILTSRLILRIREELTLVYGIGAASDPAWVYLDTGRFYGGGKCDPENADRCADEIHAVFAAFAGSGPTAEELESARKQILNGLDTDLKDPRYWLSLLRHLELRHRSLDDFRSIREDYAALTGEQVRDVFRQYCVPERQFSVVGVPAASASRPAAAPATAP